jgi:hypothetical protein
VGSGSAALNLSADRVCVREKESEHESACNAVCLSAALICTPSFICCMTLALCKVSASMKVVSSGLQRGSLPLWSTRTVLGARACTDLDDDRWARAPKLVAVPVPNASWVRLYMLMSRDPLGVWPLMVAMRDEGDEDETNYNLKDKNDKTRWRGR